MATVHPLAMRSMHSAPIRGQRRGARVRRPCATPSGDYAASDPGGPIRHCSHLPEAACTRSRLRSRALSTQGGTQVQPVTVTAWTFVPHGKGPVSTGNGDTVHERRIRHDVPVIASPDDRAHPRAVDDRTELGALDRSVRTGRPPRDRGELAGHGW